MVKGIKGGRMMESITATKQELKELMEKGFFVRAEPVKKGDTPVYLGYNNTLSKTGPLSEIWNKSGETIANVGDVCPVKNKKGEKQWFCPKCGFHSGHNYNKHSDIINLGEHSVKPLLVWLTKIEKGSNKPIGTTITKLDSWIETFKRVKE